VSTQILQPEPRQRELGRELDRAAPASFTRELIHDCLFLGLVVLLSLILYVFTGVFWLPVVWIQMQLRDIARQAAASGAPLPARYHRLYWTWFAFGWPAFAAVLAILWLMVVKPQFRLI